MKRTGFRGLAVAVVVAGLVAGCSGAPPDGGTVGAATDPPAPSSPSSPPADSPTSTTTQTPTPDPRPTAATSEHPARNIPEPEMPAAAKKHTAAGLKAFTKYWFELVDYAYQTGKTQTLEKLSNDECRACLMIVNTVHKGFKNGDWIDGGRIITNGAVTRFEQNTEGTYSSFTQVTQTELIFYAANGDIAEKIPAVTDGLTYQVIAVPVQGGWFAYDVGAPQGSQQ